MSKDPGNVWLANLGADIRLGNTRVEASQMSTTNSIGLPIIREATADVWLNVLNDNNQYDDEDELKKEVRLVLCSIGAFEEYPSNTR